MDTQKTRFIVCEFYVVYCESYVQEYEQTKVEHKGRTTITVSYGQLLVKAVYVDTRAK